MFWKGVGDFVWGKTRDGAADVSGLTSFTVGTGQCYGDCG